MTGLIKMKLTAYIEEYNYLMTNLKIDTALGYDDEFINYDKGKACELRKVIRDLADLLSITVNKDVNGIFTIAE